jgi:hypothetical protein
LHFWLHKCIDEIGQRKCTILGEQHKMRLQGWKFPWSCLQKLTAAFSFKYNFPIDV